MTTILHVSVDLSLCAGLARAQARAGDQVRVVTPKQGVDRLARRITPLRVDAVDIAVWEGTLPSGRVPVYHLDAAETVVARSAVQLMRDVGLVPDVVHAHDLAGAPALAAARPAATVLTLHHPPAGAEVPAADLVTAPSPRAAQALPGVVGVLGGVDRDVWNPGADPLLPARFGPDDLAGKAAVKTRLQQDVGLPLRPHVPLFAIGRLGAEEGTALLVEAGEELSALDAQWVILGRGERRFEEALSALGRRHPNRVAFRADADEALVHRLMAGADFLVLPANVDPAGTAAMIGLRHGTLAVARQIGGLDDVVVDYDPESKTGSGVKFEVPSPPALVAAVKRAIALHRDGGTLRRLQARAMALDFSWDASARRYAELYRRIKDREAPR